MEENLITLNLTIEKLCDRGHGVARLPDMPRKKVEIPAVLPGEVVTVTMRRRRRRLRKAKATLLALLTPSKERVEPRCAHFGSCGGCAIQQMEYGAQVRYKEANLRRAFEPLQLERALFHPIIEAPELFDYRSKMEFSFSEDLAGNRYLGLVMSGGKGRVLTVTRCHLASSWFSEVLAAVRAWWSGIALSAYHPPKGTGHLISLVLREGYHTGSRLIMLVVSGDPLFALNRDDLASFQEAVADLAGGCALFLQIKQAARGVPTQLFEMHLSGPDKFFEQIHIDCYGKKRVVDLHVSPSSFLQPNTRAAGGFYSRAIELLDLKGDELLLDLYCGIGSIGLACSAFVRKVVGIEINPYAVYDARFNAIKNGMANIEIHKGDVGEVLGKLGEVEPLLPDVVVVDPPRSGLGGVAVAQLLKLGADKICYISCNPESQARDLALLLQDYQVVAVQPADQFPHTVHLENIVILRRAAR